MKKRFALGILFFALAAGAASANIATLRMGYYVPNLKGDFWDIEFEQMSFKKSGFQSVSFGLQYEAFLSRGFSLLLAADVFSKNKGGYYNNYVGNVDEEGNAWAFPYPEFKGQFDPNHSITVTSVPVQASVKWTPFGRRGNIIPYVGGGGHVMFWNMRMAGAIVDFSVKGTYVDEDDQSYDVYLIRDVNIREADGLGRVSFGWQAFGGLMIPVGRRMTIDVGGHYYSCPAEFKNSFKGFDPIDAGGFQFALGVNYWF